MVTLLALPSSALGASPDAFWTRCAASTDSDIQCGAVRGVATSPLDGHVLVGNASFRSVVELSAWGKFLKTWGWGVVKSGPDNKPQNEIQEVTVDATGGTFKLRLSNGSATRESAAISFDASAASVRAALEAMGPPEGVLPGVNPGDVAVSGPVGGPWAIEFTGALADADIRQMQVAGSTLSGGSGTATVSTIQGGANFEICVPANGDVCRGGDAGGSPGEFSGVLGVAVDSAGSVYVADRAGPSSARVEKFSPSGEFLLTWGKEVNAGTGANKEICTNAGPPENVCTSGGQGTGPGQFGEWPPVGSFIGADTRGTETASDDRIYVGDAGRIQSFNVNGEYVADLPDPGSLLPGKRVTALAAVPGGNLFVGLEGATNVIKLNASSGAKECEGQPPVAPQAIAVDAAGNAYVFQAGAKLPVHKFDSGCQEVIEEILEHPFFPTFPFNPGFNQSFGIATGSACLNSGYDLYVANTELAPGSQLRAFGQPPDKLTGPGELCEPPPHAPEIESQGAVSVESDRASVRATINPQFWNDTQYYVQFATAECIQQSGWEAQCVSKKPTSPAQLGAGTTDVGAKTAKVILDGLASGVEYEYRFVAESSGGGPVFGRGGTEAMEGKAAFFVTTTAPSEPEACPNGAFRGGAGAFLPDCRAYEMVSPVNKNGGDIHPDKRDTYMQASPSGDRITYGSEAAFGDQVSNKFYNQYVASREEESPGHGRWSSHGINAPLGRQLTVGGLNYPTAEVNALSPDLCAEWLIDYNTEPLNPDAHTGYVNLYQQNLCGESGFETVVQTAPAGLGEAGVGYLTSDAVEGFSAGHQHVLFVAGAGLTPDAVQGKTNNQIYDYAGSQLHLVSVLPDGSPDPGEVSRGAAVGGGALHGVGGILAHAVSADGSKVFWTSKTSFPSQGGPIFLRLNPAQPESNRLHGAASGSGDLIGPASGTGKTTLNTKAIREAKFESGVFAMGQRISGAGIPAETTIVSIEEEEGKPNKFKITVDKSSTATASNVPITGAPSATVTNLTTETGAFQAGQELSGEGVPVGAAVESVNETEHTLLMSAPAVATKAGAHLSATSECTEPAKACTVPVSEGSATFWGATTNGEEALYSEGTLEDEAGAAVLYRFVSSTQARIPIAEHVLGVLGASDDLSRIYYISTSALTPGQQNANGDKAQAGQPNLYLDEEGDLTFIGTLLSGSSGDVAGDIPINAERGAGSTYRLGSYNPRYNAARVTADGAHIAFQSRAQLTGFDNTDANSGKPDLEVFTYEAGGELHCVSCNSSGVQPSGKELFRTFQYVPVDAPTGVWSAAWIPSWEHGLHGSNVLSENGQRIFFMSYTPLVSRDTNGAQDVYEWEAAGEGRCQESSPAYRAVNGGCVYLISTGESPFESLFWDASRDGRDVFFTTESSLVGEDPGAIDLYDAREGGGFAQPSQPAECEGEACQGPSAPPNDPTPASSGFAVDSQPGPGCPKGKVRRNGRCVAKKKHHRHAKHGRRRQAKSKGRAAR